MAWMLTMGAARLQRPASADLDADERLSEPSSEEALFRGLLVDLLLLRHCRQGDRIPPLIIPCRDWSRARTREKKV